MRYNGHIKPKRTLSASVQLQDIDILKDKVITLKLGQIIKQMYVYNFLFCFFIASSLRSETVGAFSLLSDISSVRLWSQTSVQLFRDKEIWISFTLIEFGN